MEPTNHPFGKENDLPNLHEDMFQPLIFRGVRAFNLFIYSSLDQPYSRGLETHHGCKPPYVRHGMNLPVVDPGFLGRIRVCPKRGIAL